MRIAEVMTRDVERVAASETPQRALTLLRMRRIHQLVVTENQRVIGVVTEDDLLSPRAADVQAVSDLMTRHVVTATPELPVRKAANLLRGSAIGALPVLDRGKLVGIVTVSDLLEMLGHGGDHPAYRLFTPRWIARAWAAGPAPRNRARAA